MWSLSALSFDARYKGDYELAQHYSQTTLDLAKSQDEPRLIADCYSDLAGIAQLRGHYQEALHYLDEALKLYQRSQDYGGECWSLGYKGLLELRFGQVDEAETFLQRALQLAEENKGQRWRTLYSTAALHTGAGPPKEEQPCKILFITHLGLVAVERHEYEKARQHISTGLQLIQEMQEPWLESLILVDLGRVELLLGHDTVALGYFLQSLNLSQLLRWTMPALSALGGIAELRRKQGQLELAAELASLVLHHPATEYVHKDLAKALLANLALPKTALEAALERGKKLSLERLRDELLQRQTIPT